MHYDSANIRTKKKAFRSPNHPAFDLPIAIAKAKEIFATENRSDATAKGIIKCLGYSPEHPAGARALSALRQYGLLEQTDGEYTLSELALRIIDLPEGSHERKDAIQTAALQPRVYRQLWEQYPGRFPSDETLWAVLIAKGFHQAVLHKVIRNFRSTMAFAIEGCAFSTNLKEQRGTKQACLVHTFSFPLSDMASAQLTLKGKVTPENIGLLRRYLKLMIQALTDS